MSLIERLLKQLDVINKNIDDAVIEKELIERELKRLNKTMTCIHCAKSVDLDHDCPKLEEVHVCRYCFSEVYRMGEDLIDYCKGGCGCIEGETTHITQAEYERKHG